MADEGVGAPQVGAYALRPARAYLLLATVCAGGAVLALVLDRGDLPGREAAVALVGQAVICAFLAASYSLQETRIVVAERIVALVVVGLLTAVPGYFFGAFGGFVVLLVLVCALAGVLSGSSGARHPALVGWVTYASVAGAQIVMGVLVGLRVLPDHQVLPMLSGNPPPAHAIFSMFGVQGVYLIAFLSGREFRRRYRQLADEVDDTIRTATIRETLLAEARAEYRRALAVARRALGTEALAPAARPALGPDDTEVDRLEASIAAAVPGLASPSPPPSSAAPSPSRAAPAAMTVAPDSPSARTTAEIGAPWTSAYRQKMRNLVWITLFSAVIGGAVLWVVAFDRQLLLLAWGCLAGLSACALLQRWISRRRGDESVYWPWAIVGALSAGVAVSMGLHSPLGGPIGLALFVGGLFRGKHRRRPNDRVFIILSTCSAHLLVFVLVYLGYIPDAGNIPVMPPGAPWWEPVVMHVLVQGSYVAAFVAGVVVDRSYEALTREAEAAARHAAHQQAMLAAANAQIHRVLGKEGEAIFVDQRVGPYRLKRMLGRGGMGDVYEGDAGSDTGGVRRAAVKLVRRDRAADPVALSLLEKEARALARVRSPYVAEVYDVGLGDELPWVAMELVEGRTLHSLLEERGKLGLDELREMSVAIARGLGAVHDAGIVHRDVKPSNIMLARSESAARWKLVDFGVAQIHDLVGAADSVVAGTPQYMSPEQAVGEPVDARADLYSLSLVIYRALTGRPAFVGSDRLEIARRARDLGPPHPRRFAELPLDVELVLRIGLAAQREHRFDTAAELAAALEAAFAGRLSAPLRARAQGLLRRAPWSDVT